MYKFGKITGDLFTWGRGSFGCLGHGNSEDKLQPTLVQALSEHAVVDVALGSANDSHTLFVTDVGLVFACGKFQLSIHQRKII